MTSLSSRVCLFLVIAAMLAPAGCNRQSGTQAKRQAAVTATAPLAQHLAPKGLPTIAPMLAQIFPTVVNISVQGAERVANPVNRHPHFGRYSSGPRGSHTEHFSAVGSGVIIDARDGFVVTNSHVVRNARRIEVTLSDRRERQGRLIGTDPQSDIAILKIKADGLKGIPLGTSSDVRVGDYVVAIGDPYGVGQTTTFGIVSGLGRTDLGIEKYEDFIQTDASINPGNSGGALVNMAGQLIGMNTAILSGSGGSVGVGFAIPVDMVRMLARALIQSGRVSRGSLGVVVQDLTPAIARAFDLQITAGALVTQVTPSSPAAKVGIKSGDVITHMNGIAVASSNDLRTAVGEEPPGTIVHLAFLRNGREQTAQATLMALESAAAARARAAGPLAINGLLSGTKTGAIPANDPHHGKVQGVYVADVAPESTAGVAGLRQGDIILDADRKPVATAAQLQDVSTAHRAGKPLLLRVARDNGIVYLALE